MFKQLFLLLSSLCVCSAQNAPVPARWELMSERPSPSALPLTVLPTMSDKSMFQIEQKGDSLLIHAWDTSAKPATKKELVITYPGVVRFLVLTSSLNANGSAVASLRMYSAKGEISRGLLLFNTRSGSSRIVSTGSFVVNHPVIADNGFIFSLGWLAADILNESESDFSLLQVFDPDGKLIREVLPKSTFGLSKNQFLIGTAIASGTKAGVVLYFPQVNEVVELKSPSARVERWKGPSQSTRNVRGSSLLACGDETVLLKSVEPNKAPQLHLLSQATSRWSRLVLENPSNPKSIAPYLSWCSLEKQGPVGFNTLDDIGVIRIPKTE